MDLIDYPFWQYINEDKSHYTKARDLGYIDPDDDFLVGESGGFLLNIDPDWKFVNTDLFRPAAIAYKKNKGKYSLFREDSLPHINFRKKEEVRRHVGLKQPCYMNVKTGEVREIRITGEHYNFINYCPILQLDDSSVAESIEVTTGKKVEDFPKFIDCQYWYFKIKEFCMLNGFHLINAKTRRGGFSYMEATGSANYINLNRKRNIIHAAIDSKFLTQSGGLSDFMKKQMVFYENRTPFKRGIAKIDTADFTLGYKNKDGTISDDSWNSSCISVSSFNNPACAVGKDAGVIKCEEMSEFENFNPFMDVTLPTLRTGAVTTGFLNAWGTAGANPKAWVIFEENFYDPKSFGFMPFENVWDKDSRHDICGYFKPFCWGLQGYLNGKRALDKDGNSDFAVAFEIAMEERKTVEANAKTFSQYIKHCGQYAMMPSESFSSITENAFSSAKLDAWENRLKHDKDLAFYTDGKLIEEAGEVKFISNARMHSLGMKYEKDFFDYIKNVPRHGNENPMGCVRVWFHPKKYTFFDGEKMTEGIPKGLYSISYDPYGIDKSSKEITLKHSHASITVWENPTKYNGFKGGMVMKYYGRPDRMEDADKICLLMAIYYNCIGTTCVEINRGETVSNFKKWKAVKYLKKEPIYLWDSSVKGKVEGNYGFSMGTDSVKLEALRMAVEMLYSEIGRDDNGEPILLLHRIYDYQTILELKKWNIKGNFDRVSDLLIRAVEWAANDAFAAKALEARKSAEVPKSDFWTRPMY